MRVSGINLFAYVDPDEASKLEEYERHIKSSCPSFEIGVYLQFSEAETNEDGIESYTVDKSWLPIRDARRKLNAMISILPKRGEKQDAEELKRAFEMLMKLSAK